MMCCGRFLSGRFLGLAVLFAFYLYSFESIPSERRAVFISMAATCCFGDDFDLFSDISLSSA